MARLGNATWIHLATESGARFPFGTVGKGGHFRLVKIFT